MAEQEPTIAERLEAAEKVQAEEDRKVAEADQLRRLLVLDLRAKFRAEVGKEHQDFEVVEFSAIDKVVAVKIPSKVVLAALDRAIAKRPATYEDLVAFVVPSVLYPTAAEFTALHTKHPEVLAEVGNFMREMTGLRLRERQGK